jgi:hypothetical protein
MVTLARCFLFVASRLIFANARIRSGLFRGFYILIANNCLRRRFCAVSFGGVSAAQGRFTGAWRIVGFFGDFQSCQNSLFISFKVYFTKFKLKLLNYSAFNCWVLRFNKHYRVFSEVKFD